MAAETVTEVYTGPTISIWTQPEVTYGTVQTTTTWTKTIGLLTPDCTVSMKNNLNRIFALGSRLTQQDVATKFEVTATVTGAFQIGRFLSWGIGTDVKGGATPYTHTFATSSVAPNSTLASFSMLVSRGVSAANITNEIYSGCKINTITFKGTLDAPLEVTLDIIAKDISAYTPAAVTYAITYDTDMVLPPQMGTLTLGTTDVADVQSFDMTIGNNLEPIFALGNRTVQQLMPKTFTMDVRATVMFTDIAALNRFNKFLGDAASPFGSGADSLQGEALKIVYTNGLLTTNIRSITFDLSTVKWDTMNLTANVNNVATMELSGHAFGLTATGIVTADNNNVVYPL